MQAEHVNGVAMGGCRSRNGAVSALHLPLKTCSILHRKTTHCT